MFSSKKSVTIEISDANKELLGKLDNDIEALVGLVDELVATHTKILSAVQGEIVMLVGQAVGEGVQVFESDKPKGDDPPVSNGKAIPQPPNAMSANPAFGVSPEGEDRVRSSPFTRAPRNVQVEWLKEVMSDGSWHAPIVIAREVANDERHYRYLKHALSGRMREMHEEGLAERRSSHVKGSMFEYRLIPATEHAS